MDFDEFTEFIIDNHNFLQDEKEFMIRDIFVAVDLNGDGLMSLSEFELVMKVFHYRSIQDIYKLFDEYAESGLLEATPHVKYLSLETFSSLSLDKDLFSPKAQLSFIDSKDVEKDYSMVKMNVESVAMRFKGRLAECDMSDNFELMELI